MDGDGQIEQIKRHFQEFFENQVELMSSASFDFLDLFFPSS
jgi:hypothetical protein